MTTKSYGHILRNLDTVNRLCESYDTIRTCRNSRGRAAFDHITRSAILFLASAFEVYIEDVINECCNQNIQMAQDAKKLPHGVRSTLCDYTKRDKTPFTPIDLCDTGWKQVYKEMTKEETDKLNTPKVVNIKNLFSKYIGIPQTSIDGLPNITQLDSFISFRGDITHRVRADKYVGIEDVNSHKTLVENLVLDIDKMILDYFKTTYPGRKAPWRNTY